MCERDKFLVLSLVSLWPFGWFFAGRVIFGRNAYEISAFDRYKGISLGSTEISPHFWWGEFAPQRKWLGWPSPFRLDRSEVAPYLAGLGEIQ